MTDRYNHVGGRLGATVTDAGTVTPGIAAGPVHHYTSRRGYTIERYLVQRSVSPWPNAVRQAMSAPIARAVSSRESAFPMAARLAQRWRQERYGEIAHNKMKKNSAKSRKKKTPAVVESNHKLKSRNPPQRSDSLTIPPTDLF